jgi:dTDP-4-dehydrorhamnose 3,5-epimerase-like enzyme
MSRNVNKPTIINLQSIVDERGNLNILESFFPIMRIYSISGVKPNIVRGRHGHRTLKQIFISQSGQFTIKLNDGFSDLNFQLNNPKFALYVPEGYWRELVDFSDDCICLVLASDCYDKNDYIYEFAEFVEWKKGKIL